MKYKITIVIPTYNRKEQLRLTLVGLLNQTVHDFEIIICDDGSTDGTEEMAMGLAHTDPWFDHELWLKYYWHPHKEGVERQVSLARNQGARLVSKDTTHILFLDSDVILNPKAIECYYQLIEEKPHVVICGRYDWLPPMVIKPGDIKFRWDDLVGWGLPPKEIPGKNSRTGDDQRKRNWDDGAEFTIYGGSALSGNLLIPIEAFHKTGGFDENLKERGQDSEFGHHLEQEGFIVIFSAKVIGYHVNHRALGREGRLSERRAIRYIHKKYDKPLDESKLKPIPEE